MSLLLPTLALASRIASTRHGAIDDHDGYDWRRSTSENHRNPAAPLRHEFAASRARLDYSWHVHYSLRRQEQQDAIIRRMLRDGAVGGAEHSTPAGRGVLQGLRQVLSRWQQQRRGAVGAPAQPWAIFTAGCMGAGKTHVMELLDENGLLPLSSFVRIDVDRIRAALPETRTYKPLLCDLFLDLRTYERLNAQTAGLLTQLEARLGGLHRRGGHRGGLPPRVPCLGRLLLARQAGALVVTRAAAAAPRLPSPPPRHRARHRVVGESGRARGEARRRDGEAHPAAAAGAGVRSGAARRGRAAAARRSSHRGGQRHLPAAVAPPRGCACFPPPLPAARPRRGPRRGAVAQAAGVRRLALVRRRGVEDQAVGGHSRGLSWPCGWEGQERRRVCASLAYRVRE
ncbi:hypothetical protein EMIHUDRAFT_439870 [Emiliania huxleyi CCMP1516]|uniref:Zeta toxin domain-containing protein n=2 Tax=Emiliania huxleyi TaxID=2903 RepID=A0A0D3KUE9_EMIH1|nr:hypothetical protein EMIHUDRAFT_439870 [Emiliania huxleyi CCMP1516]EOD39384.1 hypothetical protein EMIHUDRAFT_439870 [Emiliania huxleyi CCMP1516]|eukprot:XP_005791813.1 hypothetical protein EMIHUDRAFT_439870 [Emiliania huxleyi CCMP1516]